MQWFNVTLHQNSKLDFFKTWLTFQIEIALSYRRVWKASLWNICKNKASVELYNTVTVTKHTFVHQKSDFCFGKKVFWQWWIEFSIVCTNFTSLSWCSFVLLCIVHHLSIFKHCFCFFYLSTVSSSLSVFCSYCFVIFINIFSLFMALCLSFFVHGTVFIHCR